MMSVNCSRARTIYIKLYEKIWSGGLEVSLSIDISTSEYKKNTFYYVVYVVIITIICLNNFLVFTCALC